MEPKVKFYLHSPNANKPTPIMMVFHYGFITTLSSEKKKKYHRLKMGVGWNLNPKDWNPDFQRVSPQSRNPDKISINTDLGGMEKKVMESYKYFTIQRIQPTVEQLRGKILDDKPIQLYDVKTSIQEYIKNYKLNCGLKRNTTKNYQRLVNKIVAYQKKTKKELYFETMNADTFRDFFKFVGNKIIKYRHRHWQTITQNAMADYKKNLRKFFKLAASEGIKVNTDYKLKEFTSSYEVADAVYLTMDRIQELIRYDLTKAGRNGLQLTKDLLIIGCYTALRNSDWKRIGSMYFNKNGTAYLKVRTLKSRKKTVVSLPVYSPLMEIYKRYGNRFPSPQSDQKFNTSVKQLGKLMGWNEIVKVSVTRAYEQEEDNIEEYPFYELLSSHTGRRSFATNALKAGVNPLFIMQFTGHKRIADFFSYVKLTASDNTELFYEQTRNFFEPTSPCEEDSSSIPAFGYELPLADQTPERRTLRSA